MMHATLDDYADTLRQMGYAIEADTQAIVLPAHWRVYQYGRWWVLCYWLAKGKRAGWERYGLYNTLQEAIEKGLEL
jgi:hypothetical protein